MEDIELDDSDDSPEDLDEEHSNNNCDQNKQASPC